MDFKQIQELIKIVNKSNIGEISVEDGEFKITIKQKEDNGHGFTVQAPAYIPAQSFTPALQPPAPAANMLPSSQPSAASAKESAATKESPSVSSENTITIKSPMIGTFYRSSSPDNPPFASVGDEILVGSKVCIIEAMKLFNEIESEVKGTIVKVLVDDATPVEYDQPLFLVEPA